jgi:hypothetical protein
MPDVSSPYIDMWKDWEPDVLLLQRNAQTREWEPATGLVGITFRVSLTEQGAPIGTLHSIPAIEAALAESEFGLGARYVGVVDLSVLTSEMPAADPLYADGEEVFLQVLKPGDIVVEAIRKVIRRTRY